MGKRAARYVAKAYAGGRWRVWDRKLERWWGNPFTEYPTDLLVELNGAKRPAEITQRSRTTQRP